ncbi:MAG: GNAT family N-acetyltransferase [Bacteroidota bacterium]
MATINPEVINIHHDTKERKLFFVQKGADIQDARLEYKLHIDAQPNVVEFTHTYVPETIQGIGFAQELAHEGMRFARANGYQVKSSCDFVTTFLNDNPQYNQLKI